MASETDISLRHVSKSYRTRRGKSRGWSGKRFWALRDVSFDVAHGEALGIIGPNGSGKSTLIKLLARITAPDEGTIAISGRLMSLVEVGAGFHPELSGRENVFLSAAIFGVTRSEIRARFDEIVAFSGIAGFIDEPVKTYSSGMIVRLGFSVAAHLDSDILLLDEVLAVGDVAFQVRCLDRIAEIRRSGRTILLVSHDLAAVERLCDRALLLQGGEVQADGPPRDVVEAYQALAGAALAQSGAEPASGPLAFRGIAFANPAGGSARTGDPLDVRVALDAAEVIDDALCTVSFMWPSGYLCTELVSQPGRIDPGPTEVLFEVPRLAMQRGLYTVDLMVASRGRTLIQRKRIAPFRVDPGVITRGDFHMDHRSVVRARGE